MSKIIVLYNPLAGNSTCGNTCKMIEELYKGDEVSYVDFTTIDGYQSFFDTVDKDSVVILCGGDGTLNYFANNVDVSGIENELLYFPAGSGNDFYNDIEGDKSKKAYPLKKYLKSLPTVEVAGIRKKFINGIGYGIDGYCCEEGDRIREAKPGKPVNYSLIAIKGLLYDFHRTNARVTVDGQLYEYKDVWMAPTMNGRFYGGGMMCAPNQNRLNEEGTVSVIVVSTPSRARLLTAFLSIFKGEHLKYSLVHEFTGKEVHVEFDRQTALQIDGETVKGVLEYTVISGQK